MNYKKSAAMGILVAMGALAPQKGDAYTYFVEQPVIYDGVSYYATPQPYYPPVAPVNYSRAYYDGYYDAMNRRWWYGNRWYNYRPRYCPPPAYNWGYHGCAPRPYRCPPAPHFNRCAPVPRPHFNRCMPAPRPHFRHCR